MGTRERTNKRTSPSATDAGRALALIPLVRSLQGLKGSDFLAWTFEVRKSIDGVDKDWAWTLRP